MPSLTNFKEVLTTAIWSPILWKDDTRARENFLSCKYAALDFDDGTWTLETAEAWCKAQGYSAIIGTSKSHQLQKITPKGVVRPAVDRFRLVIPFDTVITDKATYEFNMRRLVELTPCDPSCTDAARYFFPCKEIVFSQFGVKSLPVHPPDDDHEAEVQEYQEAEVKEITETGQLPLWLMQSLWFGAEEGGRHKACYRIGATLARAGKSEQEIISAIMQGPLGAIGVDDVKRAVRNGIKKAQETTGCLTK